MTRATRAAATPTREGVRTCVPEAPFVVVVTTLIESLDARVRTAAPPWIVRRSAPRTLLPATQPPPPRQRWRSVPGLTDPLSGFHRDAYDPTSASQLHFDRAPLSRVFPVKPPGNLAFHTTKPALAGRRALTAGFVFPPLARRPSL